jgi:hypothetical protein
MNDQQSKIIQALPVVFKFLDYKQKKGFLASKEKEH